MTHAAPPSKATRTARRATRLDALAYLWDHSTLNRVRACRLHVSDVAAGAALQVQPDGSARWSGLQSCGSTWACPVCADRIQAGRKADVAAMIDAAHRAGMVVAFLTFTVRHRRTQSLRDVWNEVADAWRQTTSGGSGASQRAWNSDREEFGIAGYLRLWETTHGESSGWHVHVHALVFLDPTGMTKTVREAVTLLEHDHDLETFDGSLFDLHAPCPGTTAYDPCKCQQRRRFRLSVTAALPRVRHGIYDHATGKTLPLPGLKGAWRRPEGPLPTSVLVPDTRKVTRSGPATVVKVGAGRADDNWFADVAAGRSPRRGLYRRDVVDLGRRLFERWQAALPAGMAPPTVCGDQSHACRERRRVEGAPHSHGWDARIVDDVDVLSEYFTKNTLTVKGVESAALDVTSSTSKGARVGNRTPFGILADLVAGTSEDPVTDRRLWREWESTSKGRRQLRSSDGLRDLLGLGVEPMDEDLAGDDVDQAADVVDGDPLTLARVPASLYRCMALGGMARWALELAEDQDFVILYQLLRGYGHDPDVDDVRPCRQLAGSP